jgi:hypothetical protein
MRRVRQIFGFAFAQWVFIAWGFFFLSPAYGIDLTIRWDPSDASNLLGYKIYYKTGSPGQPYQGEEALEGSSPIQVHAYEVTTGEVC